MSALLDFVKFHELSNWSVAHLLQTKVNYSKKYKIVKLKEFLKVAKMEWIDIEDSKEYTILGVRGQGQGVYINRVSLGKELTMKKYQKSKEYCLFYCKVRTVKGQWGIVYPEFEDSYGSSNMQYLEIDLEKILPEYIELLLKVKKITDEWDKFAIGADGRHFPLNTLLNLTIPLPSLDIQKQIVKNYQSKINLANEQAQNAKDLEKDIEEYLYDELGLKKDNHSKSNNILNFINFEKLTVWSCKDILDNLSITSTKFKTYSFNQKPSLFVDIFRGKSPKYEDNSKSVILNQKCNRWNDLELEYSKSVNDEWFEKLDKKFFTKLGDILINSTGDGTIGRATYITKEFENLIYDSHLLLLRVDKNEINSLFLTYCINSDLGQKQIENIKSAVATKQTELGINNLKNLQFIIPEISTQNEITASIKEMKNQIKFLNEESEKNKIQALEEFEKEVFNEDK